MASIYTFQSGKQLVCTESLTGAQLLPPTIWHNEDPPFAHNPYQVWDTGDFLEHMPFSDGYVIGKTSKRKCTAADHPLAAWEPECLIFLDELICLEGHGDDIINSLCSHCKEAAPTIHCKDCFLLELHCPSCTRWNGTYFEQTTLKMLGLRIQLGHQIGDTCCNPHRAFNDNFMIINMTVVHKVALDFCACETMQTHVKQLLRERLFPATIIDPKTAATFGVLEQYHLLSFESKASTYEFYQGLAHLSDNTGINPPKDRYPTFLHIIHKWRILKLLKRFARGHCPDGVPMTEPGQCAVLCPACPQPGMNLPEDWKDTSPDKQWLYALFVGIDANFCLKQKCVSSDAVDAGINKGWSYFIEEKAYKAYLEDHKDRNQERSTCASLAATGVGTVNCARHNMKLWNAVGDLQKAFLRYINMVYLFFSAMRHQEVVILNILYDIACQWSKNLWSWMSTLPSAYHLDHNSKTINFFILKFHFPAHIEPCQIDFSFNFSLYIGQTDGEAPERGWANINPIASSTKEMGPGSRHDTLDDHIGRLTARKLANAIEERSTHQRKLIELQGCMQMEDISQWRDEVEAWGQDRTQLNPFKAAETQATVRLELAHIEAAELETGNNISLHTDVPPSILISSRIDLEEQQQHLSFEIETLSTHATDNQLTKVQQHTNVLCRKIDTWLYMPFVSRLHASEESIHSSAEPMPVEATQLWLPSAAGPITQYNNIVGQAANNRARSMINKADNKISMATRHYEAARAALTSLAPLLNEDDTWKDVLKPLNRNKDLKSFKDMGEKETEGIRHLSGIWKTPGVSENTSAGLHNVLHIEWCKARAHAMRCKEEVELLKEEQRRIIAFMDWQADWWWSQQQCHDSEPLDDPGLREGLVAYAECQASVSFSELVDSSCDLLIYHNSHG
ncbi:hypothetical protein BD769DRAFT_1630016 [Suillus cothurnatus]|nr:hypothetical protein BD769DRAFT_1630016 [Suillus cothurnatus]